MEKEVKTLFEKQKIYSKWVEENEDRVQFNSDKCEFEIIGDLSDVPAEVIEFLQDRNEARKIMREKIEILEKLKLI